jgi:hypothetical protein
MRRRAPSCGLELRQLGGGDGGEGIPAVPVRVLVGSRGPFPFLPFPSLHLPRVDGERLCDSRLQVQEEMSETIHRLQWSSCLQGMCTGMRQVCDETSMTPEAAGLSDLHPRSVCRAHDH